MTDDRKHIPLDLSLPWNAHLKPQCWTCGLPWPCDGTLPDWQLQAILDEEACSWPVVSRLVEEIRTLRAQVSS